MNESKTPPSIWHGQWLHAVCLALLLVPTWVAWDLLGKPDAIAFWLAIAFPIVHQIYVWLAWRLELQSSSISKTIGFTGYIVCFFVLFGGRFASLVVLAWLDEGSLGLPPVPRVVATAILVLPGGYAMYSVMRYFGMSRAAGADHFDAKYRDLPLVNSGIFRFTSNGMYVFAFFLFWAIAIGFNSSAALTVAAFSHAYIWVHFFGTERPDMEFLYGEDPSQREATPSAQGN